MMPTGLEKIPAQDIAPGFDFSALGDLSAQATEVDQQFDLHYGTAQDEYLISCIYVAQMHALTAKAGRYGGGTWTKWYESKGLGEGSVRRMIQNGDAFKSANVAELKCLPELTRKDLNLIARSGCADQLVEAAGDSQRVQELLAQLKAKDDAIAAEKARADTAEAHLSAANADITGLTEQNAQLKEQVTAAEAREEEAWQMQSKAEARARNAEDALKKQPIVGVTDKEEVRRQAKALAHQWDEEELDKLAAEKAWGMADARNAELAKDNASLKKQLAQMRSQLNDNTQADFETANYCASLFRAAWDNSKAAYSRLTGEDLESAFQTLCGTLRSIMEEVALLCRQPAGYDGGVDNEPDV